MRMSRERLAFACSAEIVKCRGEEELAWALQHLIIMLSLSQSSFFRRGGLP